MKTKKEKKKREKKERLIGIWHMVYHWVIRSFLTGPRIAITEIDIVARVVSVIV